MIQEYKDTTKVRIVFDASAKGNGPNEGLYKGPQLTPLIFDILLRFRTFAVALTAVIEKAFSKLVLIHDRDYLRFLWFEDVFDEVQKIVCNRFHRVLSTMISSLYLINGTVQKHAKAYNFNFEFIKNSFKKVRLIEGLFLLRKWRTNDEKLRYLINEKDDEYIPVI